MSFLSNLQTKAAHSSITAKMGGAMGGKGGIAQLQDLIASEKAVVAVVQRLSGESKKSADTLRDWGCSENQGDDLFDILSKVAFLFEHLSTAERRYAEHLGNYRMAFKTLRTREEHFIELRKRKDQLANKIDGAKKTLEKTGPEHKERAQRIQRLEDLQAEMSSMEHAVANEDARLGDFKRSTVREALGLKLGAMLELAEKTSIVAEMCKLLIAEVPREMTQPGTQRAYYTGTAQTTEVMEEASKCLAAVVFDANTTGLMSGAEADTSYEQDTSREQPYPPNDYGTPNISRMQYATEPPASSIPPRIFPDSSYDDGPYEAAKSQRGRAAPFRIPSNSSFGPRQSGAQPLDDYSGPAPHHERAPAGVVAHDYGQNGRADGVAHPIRLAEEQYQQSPIEAPMSFHQHAHDRQSFPASVRDEDNNRSSLAYMGMDESATPELGGPEVTHINAPARVATPPVGAGSASPRVLPPRAQRDPRENADAHYDFDESNHWVKNHATAPHPQESSEPPVAAPQYTPQPPRQLPIPAAPANPPPVASAQASGLPVPPERTPSAAPSQNASFKTPPQSPRPQPVRGDSALGSRHGFDAPVYGQQPTTTTAPPSASTASPARYAVNPPPATSYSYHRATESSGSNSAAPTGRITAGNFRRSAGTGGMPPASPTSSSPAMQIREAYLAKSYAAAPPAPPELSIPPSGGSANGGSEPQSAVTPQTTAPLRMGRRSAEQAPVELTQEPRSARNGAPQATHPNAPSIAIDGWAAPPEYSSGKGAARGSGPGFGSGGFVTRLD